jgi:hypothetical protein
LGQSAGIEVRAVLDEAMRRDPGDGQARSRRWILKRAIKTLTEGEHAIYCMDEGGETFSLLD